MSKMRFFSKNPFECKKFSNSCDDFLPIQHNSKQKVVKEKVVAFGLSFRLPGRSPSLALPCLKYDSKQVASQK